MDPSANEEWGVRVGGLGDGIASDFASRHRSLPRHYQGIMDPIGADDSMRSQSRYNYRQEVLRKFADGSGLVSPTGASTRPGGGRRCRVPNSESVERMLLENTKLKTEILDSIEEMGMKLDRHVKNRKDILKKRKQEFELDQRR